MISATSDPARDLVVALQALDLQFSYVKDAQGKGYWHVPFREVILTFYAGGSATTVGITAVLNGQGNAGGLPSREEVTAFGLSPDTMASLLRGNSALGMAKVSVADGMISVSTEFPNAAINRASVEVAIAHVLHAAEYVRTLLGEVRGVASAAPTGP